jgi:hypothetical protein
VNKLLKIVESACLETAYTTRLMIIRSVCVCVGVCVCVCGVFSRALFFHTSHRYVTLGNTIFQNPRRHLKMADIQQVPRRGPTNIWRHGTKFSRPDDLAHGIRERG